MALRKWCDDASPPSPDLLTLTALLPDAWRCSRSCPGFVPSAVLNEQNPLSFLYLTHCDIVANGHNCFRSLQEKNPTNLK